MDPVIESSGEVVAEPVVEIPQERPVTEETNPPKEEVAPTVETHQEVAELEEVISQAEVEKKKKQRSRPKKVSGQAKGMALKVSEEQRLARELERQEFRTQAEIERKEIKPFPTPSFANFQKIRSSSTDQFSFPTDGTVNSVCAYFLWVVLSIPDFTVIKKEDGNVIVVNSAKYRCLFSTESVLSFQIDHSVSHYVVFVLSEKISKINTLDEIAQKIRAVVMFNPKKIFSKETKCAVVDISKESVLPKVGASECVVEGDKCIVSKLEIEKAYFPRNGIKTWTSLGGIFY